MNALLDKRRLYTVEALRRYWPESMEAVLRLPLPTVKLLKSEPLPPQTQFVRLPQWARDVGVNGEILVPNQFIVLGEEPTWARTDWLSVAFWYLNGSAERAFERLDGPIHSYSYRLKGWKSQLWERAWVNRIALFLRRWAAHAQGLDEETLFGPLPAAEIILTHDVDAIVKTMAIRLKQATFHTFNAMRNLSQGRPKYALYKFARAIRFLFSQDNYWCFDRIKALEEEHHVRSHFNFYGGDGGWRRSPKQILMDPSYRVDSTKLKQQLRQLHADGWIIGLHQSFEAWADAEAMAKERKHLEQVLDAPVTTCRQHWLRFSWEHTWKAQQEAGFVLDSTLGFNDRASFRNGAAIRFRPWCPYSEEPMHLEVLPMVLMDSHLYDYSDLTEPERHQQMAYWLDEIRFVCGTATVIWHHRVMSKDYGWSDGYKALVSMIKDRDG